MRDLAEGKHFNFREFIADKQYYFNLELKSDISIYDYINNVKHLLDINYYTLYFKSPWTYITYQNYTMPTCGWKIHISATFKNHMEILRKVIEYISIKKISCKFATNMQEFVRLNSRNIARESNAKYIVLYPKQTDFFLVLEDLYYILKEFDGPYILSDRQYKDSNVLFYRYGEINPIRIVDGYGTTVTKITDNKNKLISDKRVPYFYLPDFITDKLYKKEETTYSKLLQKYKVIESLYFSSQGGVYLAVHDDIKVVIKEARKYCGLGNDFLYGTDNLKNEYSILKILMNLKCTPQPIELIEEYGNIYLVQEFIKGTSLHRFPFKNSPIINRNKNYKTQKSDFIIKMDKIAEICISQISKIHSKGILIGDISPSNIILDEETWELKFIDLEAAYFDNDQKKSMSGLYTPGFRVEYNGSSFTKELHQIALVLMWCIMPLNSLYDLDPSKKLEVIDFYKNCDFISIKLYSLIKKLINNEFHKAEEAYEYLNSSIDENSDKKLKNEFYLEDEISSIKKSIIDNIDINNDNKMSFFAADPMAFNTNKYCMAFGIFGALYGLNNIKIGCDLPKDLIENIVIKFMADYYREKYKFTSSLFIGCSGISIALVDLGFVEEAIHLFEDTVKRENSMCDIAYGLAGRLISSLYFYDKFKEQSYLEYAVNDAEVIKDRYIERNGYYYWKDEVNSIYTGYTRGSSGIALAFLELYKRTNDKKYLDIGIIALESDLVKLVTFEDGYIEFNGNPEESTDTPIHSPYVHNGIVGVGYVLLRYYAITKNNRYYDLINQIIDSCNFDITLFPGYLRGLSGIMNFLQDCVIYINSDKAKVILKRMYKVIMIFKVHLNDTIGFAGDNLLKISNDLFTGSSGVILTLHREVEKNTKNPFLFI